MTLPNPPLSSSHRPSPTGGTGAAFTSTQAEITQMLSTIFHLTKAATEHARIIVLPEVDKKMSELASLATLKTTLSEQEISLSRREVELEKRQRELDLEQKQWQDQRNQAQFRDQERIEREQSQKTNLQILEIMKPNALIAPLGFRTQEGAEIIISFERNAHPSGKLIATLLRTFALAEAIDDRDLWTNCVKPLSSLMINYSSSEDLSTRVADLLSSENNPWGYKIIIPEKDEIVGAFHQAMDNAKRVSQVLSWAVKDTNNGGIIKRALVK
jgi:hypothetical protein